MLIKTSPQAIIKDFQTLGYIKPIGMKQTLFNEILKSYVPEADDIIQPLRECLQLKEGVDIKVVLRGYFGDLPNSCGARNNSKNFEMNQNGDMLLIKLKRTNKIMSATELRVIDNMHNYSVYKIFCETADTINMHSPWMELSLESIPDKKSVGHPVLYVIYPNTIEGKGRD